MMNSARFSAPFAMLILITTACTSKPPAEIPSPGPSPLRVGRGFLNFDDREVVEFEIARGPGAGGASAVSGWSARLSSTRPLHATARVKNNLSWSIESFSDGNTLLDRRAHSERINHLLDTLHTLNVVAIPECYAPGNCTPLARFGLDPPSFALRWRTSDGKSHELDIGAQSDPKDGGAYVRVPKIGDRVFSAQGAALAMLANLTEPQWIRERRFIPVDPDSVEEISGPKGFYVQRDGVRWADKKHKPIGRDLDLILDRALHQQIQGFVDDPVEATRLRKKLLGDPRTLHLTLDGRGLPENSKTKIWISGGGADARDGGNNKTDRILGCTTARSSTEDAQNAPVFWLYPEARTAIEALVSK